MNFSEEGNVWWIGLRFLTRIQSGKNRIQPGKSSLMSEMVNPLPDCVVTDHSRSNRLLLAILNEQAVSQFKICHFVVEFRTVSCGFDPASRA